MEPFESFVAVALEAEGLVVSPAVKFPVTLKTRRADHEEVQTHGYEVDIVGACSDRLVLATVKSFLGSRGVVAEHVMGTTRNEVLPKRYSLLNHPVIRGTVVRDAAKLYGYAVREVELRLYVGRFAGPARGIHERQVRQWARRQRVGAGPIRVFALSEVVGSCVRPPRTSSTATIRSSVTMKVLEAAGMLTETLPEDVGD